MPGVVRDALVATIGAMVTLLLVYRLRLIRFDRNAHAIAATAIGGLATIYLVTFVLSLLGMALQVGLLLVVAGLLFVQLRTASQRLYVVALSKEAGVTLAQAALSALDPAQYKDAVVEAGLSEVRLGKEGPGLEVKRRWWLGLIEFRPIGGLDEATRVELLAGVRRCLDHESVAVSRFTVVRLAVTGLLLLAVGIALLELSQGWHK